LCLTYLAYVIYERQNQTFKKMTELKFETSGEKSLAEKNDDLELSSLAKLAVSKIEKKSMWTIQEFIKETDYEIDSFIIDKFWNNMHEDFDIYIDDSIINWMGYTGQRFKVRQNFNKLLSNFTENKDYQILSNDGYGKFYDTLEGIIKNIYPPAEYGKGKYQTKHILVKPDTFREIMMMLNTKKAGDIRKYYLSLEKLLKKYSMYQQKHREKQLAYEKQLQTQLLLLSKEQLEQQKKREIKQQVKHKAELEKEKARTEEAKKRNIQITNFIANVRIRENNSFIYIATTKQYAINNQFKVGKADNLKSRLSTYNTGRPDGDQYYYAWVIPCHKSKLLENRLKSILTDWKDNKHKEMYVMHYKYLQKIVEFICNNYTKEIEGINNFIRNTMCESFGEIPMIPEKYDISIFNNGVERVKKIKQPTQQKIALDNMDSMSSDEILMILVDIVNQLVKRSGKPKFDFMQQKEEDLHLEFKWSDVVNIIPTKTKVPRGKLKLRDLWKPQMKQLILGARCIKKVKGVG